MTWNYQGENNPLLPFNAFAALWAWLTTSRNRKLRYRRVVEERRLRIFVGTKENDNFRKRKTEAVLRSKGNEMITAVGASNVKDAFCQVEDCWGDWISSDGRVAKIFPERRGVHIQKRAIRKRGEAERLLGI